MKKLLSPLFVFSSLFLFSCCSNLMPTNDIITSLDEKQENKQALELKSVVQITSMVRSVLISLDEQKIVSYAEKTSQASGVIIKHTTYGTLILTAGHVCDVIDDRQIKAIHEEYSKDKHTTENNTQFVIRTNDKMVSAVKVYSNYADETCILLSQPLSLPVSSIAKVKPKIGETIFLVGYPIGLWSPNYFPIFDGSFAGEVINEGTPSFITTIVAYHGSSGGPIFNKNGEVVSLLHGFFSNANSLSLGTTLVSLESAVGITNEMLLINGQNYKTELDKLIPEKIIQSWYEE